MSDVVDHRQRRREPRLAALRARSASARRARRDRRSGAHARRPHVMLPGVGAAADAMARLRAPASWTCCPGCTQPVLGICLGMQLLFASIEEGDDGEEPECLGLIDERVTRLADRAGSPRAAHGLEPAAAASRRARCSTASQTATTSTSCTATRRRSGAGRWPPRDYGSRVLRGRAARQFPRRAVPPGALRGDGQPAARQLPGAHLMLLIPAIDLRGGRCVRLLQGRLRRRDGLCQRSARGARPLPRPRRHRGARRGPRRCARRLAGQSRRHRAACRPRTARHGAGGRRCAFRARSSMNSWRSGSRAS